LQPGSLISTSRVPLGGLRSRAFVFLPLPLLDIRSICIGGVTKPRLAPSGRDRGTCSYRGVWMNSARWWPSGWSNRSQPTDAQNPSAPSSCPHLSMRTASSSEPPTSVGLACRPVGAWRRRLV